ncbi:hypothetical protein SLA2020_077080 [Shorea laevis]
MHDMVHEFALFLMKGEFVTKEINFGDNLMIGSEKAHHLIVAVEKGTRFPLSIAGIERLRSLKAYSGVDAFTAEALGNFFKQSRRLRLLDFSCSKGPWTEDILAEVGELTCLRHYGWGVNRELPETFSRLYSLQRLDLVRSDNLERLPDGIGNLINLTFIHTSGCRWLTTYPKGVQKLVHLRQVQGMIVRADRYDPEEFSIGDLANLNKLLLLFMKVVGNDIDKKGTRKVKLEKLHELRMYVAGHIEEDDILEAINQTFVPT